MHTEVLPNAAAIDINHLAMCRGLKPQAATRIAGIGSFRRLTSRSTLFFEGERAAGIYEVVRGMLRLYKLMPDGRRQITGFITKGHLIGLAPQQRHLHTAETVTDVTLCCYPRTRFDRLVDEVPGFARRLLDVTFDELRAAQDQMLLLGRKTAVEKIASFLLMMADRDDTADETGEVELPMGRSDIGDYLGLNSETVSRTVTKLRHDGVISLRTPVRINICDRDQLVELANGESGSEY
jgi:CRP/FNR family transcriptional regulator